MYEEKCSEVKQFSYIVQAFLLRHLGHEQNYYCRTVFHLSDIYSEEIYCQRLHNFISTGSDNICEAAGKHSKKFIYLCNTIGRAWSTVQSAVQLWYSIPNRGACAMEGFLNHSSFIIKVNTWLIFWFIKTTSKISDVIMIFL